MSLGGVRHWIFDLDGTLTVAAHDFDAIRRTLGLPPGRPILETLAERPAAERSRLQRELEQIELRIACRAEAQPGATTLLAKLQAGGAQLGIVTRNSTQNAVATLRAAGLSTFFEDRFLRSRDHVRPKPDPDGILELLALWQAPVHSAVMVGDFLFDLLAGRSAGVRTVYLDPDGAFAFAEHADFRVRSLAELERLLARGDVER